MTTSATELESIDLGWFMNGRFEKTVRGLTYSYCGDLRIVTMKGRMPWTRKIMLAMTNVRAMRLTEASGTVYMSCTQPPHPEMLSLRKYDLDILAGNCVTLASKNGNIRFTLYPFNQNARMLNEKFGMADT